MKTQPARDDWGPHNYIRDAKGYRSSGHLSAPGVKDMNKKYKRLGHVKEKKLVGWDLQKPRDNTMYHIGEGGTNLKKMDKYIKRKQGNINNLFSTNVINDEELQKIGNK